MLRQNNYKTSAFKHVLLSIDLVTAYFKLNNVTEFYTLGLLYNKRSFFLLIHNILLSHFCVIGLVHLFSVRR